MSDRPAWNTVRKFRNASKMLTVLKVTALVPNSVLWQRKCSFCGLRPNWNKTKEMLPKSHYYAQIRQYHYPGFHHYLQSADRGMYSCLTTSRCMPNCSIVLKSVTNVLTIIFNDNTANWRRCGKFTGHLPSTVKTFLIQAIISRHHLYWHHPASGPCSSSTTLFKVTDCLIEL